jgi:transglutaminase-like putative cysteine protease
MTSLDMLDHKVVSWNEVERSAYLIHQTFHYEYTGPIRQLNQRLVIVPAVRHGDQRLVTHRLEVSSPTTEIHREIDQFGNLVISLAVDYVAKAIDFTAWIVVERARTGDLPLVTGDMAPYLEGTRLTTPDTALRAAAAELRADGTTGAALADRINAWVYGRMRYAHDVTGVGTPAATAFALKSGVCQDYAQVMLVLCRLCGLPARYVSGHMLGEGGTHAWVEVLLPDPANAGQVRAHPYDPTHGRMADLRYVTVATGRDYGDVAPTSGTYVAPHAGTLSASKRAGLTEVQYAAD